MGLLSALGKLGDIVTKPIELVTDCLYRMSLPTGMQYTFKKHKEVVCQCADIKVQGIGLKV
jgi:hypothetical protein